MCIRDSLCCLRTWHVLADVIHKTVSHSGSLQTEPLVLCSAAPLPWHSGLLQELGPWQPGSSREGCQRGQCILKNNTQPLKPPGTKLCNNWLVQPCDLITVSQGFQRKLKGVKHPLDPASNHLKSSAISSSSSLHVLHLLVVVFLPELLGGQAHCQICLYTLPGWVWVVGQFPCVLAFPVAQS